MKIHLRSIALKAEIPEGPFPFDLPVIRTLEPLEIQAAVTYFVGENGSGKSTLLEAIACAAGSITAGSEQASRDASLAEVRQLADSLRLSWQARTRRGFFLRAEDFIGYIRRMAQTREELQAEIRAIDEGDDYRNRSELARGLAKMPYAGQLADMRRRYGAGLEVRSHGEQFLDFFQARFVSGGLYLLDEPEAPLSPIRQLGFLSILKEMVAQDAQFIIATHSPIIMAFPQADILNCDQTPIQRVEYDQLEHVQLTRDFLNNPDAFLRHL